MSKIEVKVPDIGDFQGVPVIEILVKAGDSIKAEDPLIVLESDKATMEVPAPEAGVVSELLVKVGDKVSEGSAILTLAAEGTPAPAPTPASAAPELKPEPIAVTDLDAGKTGGPAPILGPRTSLSDFGDIFASPAVRRLARELDIDLTRVPATGDKGRITKEDVKAFLAGGKAAAPGGATGAGIPEIPVIDFSKFGPIEEKPLSRIRKLSGPFLHRSWLNVPAVTQNDEADITDLEDFRKKLDEEGKKAKESYRVSLLPFLIRASVAVLKQYPDFNSSLSPTKDSLIHKKYWHIGFACDTPEGLVVPVIKDADKKGVLELAKELGDLSAKARAGKLSPAEMSGASFTISSLGGIGGTSFSPIVNAPEVAILGVVRSKMAPVWNGKEFVPRLMLPLSLSYDHRVIDGAAAARFARAFAIVLEDIRRLAL
ncbi:dihydrolipoyllysine-residue acetyltransferase [Rhodoblastus acidophilus]|uniref:Acetyltransferase component of pyruvate dehydrogenase complex n=1 Tax=Candidatus Rhodoblastus alkanivorans TaxID=2954117 RepID=A0ABS9Z6X9_9HYPH|nr:dihydrolipoyllysine-residue acetyltransferase [Candidatus Rhodoblastus alkanivorans]MCI4680739.1 dihydrolipoyllysine-residue acetyltransferase [Candidatus Rhodoblastus alkanivorans]MCI4683352.1 dihydrolipoyllysine-residue acetyltransferase [Candidatus Rhodoblastus alkanivorans]MDI4640665.1 dihydrolipoyllysine-residue acetyltransferase [Rhodoblastus acidophilus]